MTNYEKIKQMSIEELASWIECPWFWDENYKPNCKRDDSCDCFACVKQYLESEATSEAKEG